MIDYVDLMLIVIALSAVVMFVPLDWLGKWKYYFCLVTIVPLIVLSIWLLMAGCCKPKTENTETVAITTVDNADGSKHQTVKNVNVTRRFGVFYPEGTEFKVTHYQQVYLGINLHVQDSIEKVR